MLPDLFPQLPDRLKNGNESSFKKMHYQFVNVREIAYF